MLKLKPSEAPGSQVTLSVTDALKANTLSALSSVYFLFFFEAHDSFTRGNLSFGVGRVGASDFLYNCKVCAQNVGLTDRDGTGLHEKSAAESPA